MYHQEGEAGADAEVDVAAAEAAMGTTWTHKGVDRQGRPEAEAEGVDSSNPLQKNISCSQ